MHVHAPPIQPVTMSLSACVSLRVMAQNNMILTFKCNEKSINFQVGSKSKVYIKVNENRYYPVLGQVFEKNPYLI